MITLALTNYNRSELLFKSFAQVINDERISEIVISDDASDAAIWRQISDHYKGNAKVKLHRNASNQGVYRNKYHSVYLSSNPWVIVFDSDNIIGTDYIDKLFAIDDWNPGVLYSPDFGKPEFDYTHFAGKTITRANVSAFLREKRFDCLINTMNCFVNREQYIKIWDPNTEPIAADSAYLNYLWLNAGNEIYVVPGMQYEHLVHKGSHYVNHSHKSNAFHATIMGKLKLMR